MKKRKGHDEPDEPNDYKTYVWQTNGKEYKKRVSIKEENKSIRVDRLKFILGYVLIYMALCTISDLLVDFSSDEILFILQRTCISFSSIAIMIIMLAKHHIQRYGILNTDVWEKEIEESGVMDKEEDPNELCSIIRPGQTVTYALVANNNRR